MDGIEKKLQLQTDYKHAKLFLTTALCDSEDSILTKTIRNN